MSRPGFLPSVLALAALFAGAAPVHASADGQVAKTAPLGIFSPKERAELLPFIERGPVALIEFNDDGDLPAIVFATKLHVSAEAAAKVIGAPGEYPKFMPALDDVEVLSRHEAMISYAWSWKTALFTLRGENIMNVYAPPPGREAHGYRITVKSTRGDLGSGRMMWRLYPMTEPGGSESCLVVFSSRMDLRKANWVTKQINQGERSINRTANIALAFAMLRGVTRRAEQEAAPRRNGTTNLGPLERPKVNVKKLATILNRGDLLFITMEKGALRQVTAVGRMFAKYTKMRAVMGNPEAFGSALVPGSYVHVDSKEGTRTDFSWGIDMPLIGTSGKMRLEDRGSVVEIDAVAGAIEGGSWRFEPVRLPWREGAVVSWGRFEPEKASWLIRALVQGSPDLGQGIVIGSQVMVNRAIRTRTQR